jgi:hypothetical protein
VVDLHLTVTVDTQLGDDVRGVLRQLVVLLLGPLIVAALLLSRARSRP